MYETDYASSREAAHKDQARRLREFLAEAGVDLKHTNALEAVARMHGAPNWHALRAGAVHSTVDFAKRKPEGDLYAITTHYNGFSKVCLAEGKPLALREFLQTARLLVDVSARSDDEVIVVGQDIDTTLPVLALTINGTVIATLQVPAHAEETEVVSDKGGKARVVPMRAVDLLGLDECESFLAIGTAVTNAFASRRKDEEEARFKVVSNSLPAHLLPIDFHEELPQLAVETMREDAPANIDVDPRKLLEAIDKVRVQVSMKARVR